MYIYIYICLYVYIYTHIFICVWLKNDPHFYEYNNMNKRTLKTKTSSAIFFSFLISLISCRVTDVQVHCVELDRRGRLQFDLCSVHGSSVSLNVSCACAVFCRAARGQWYLWTWTPTTGTDKLCAPCCPESPAPTWVLLLSVRPSVHQSKIWDEIWPMKVYDENNSWSSVHLMDDVSNDDEFPD